MTAYRIDAESGWDIVAIEFYVVVDAIRREHKVIVVAERNESPRGGARHLHAAAIPVFLPP